MARPVKGWSLDRARWLELRELIKDRQWKKVYLDPLYKKGVTTSAGVYLICADLCLPPQGLKTAPFDKFFNAVYVGQSSNIRQRFSQHISGYGDVTRAKDAFGRLQFWFVELEAEKLTEIEQALMDTLGPSCNAINAPGPILARVGQAVPVGR